MEQSELKDELVSLYLNGLAHVAASVEFKNGETRETLQLTGVAKDLDLTSLHTIADSKEIQILEARILEPTTINDLLTAGITLFDVTEKVKLIEGNNVLIYVNKDHFKIVPLTDLSIVSFNLDPITERTLELKLDSVLEGELKLSYLTDGISIIPNYTITLVNGKLVLKADVEVNNKTGKSFNDVLLEVIPGEVNRPYLPTARRGYGADGGHILSLSMVAMTDGVERNEKEGQISYSFGKRNISEGRSSFGIFTTNELDYKITYAVALNDVGVQRVNSVLKFNTPETLPKGQVAVYSETDKKEKYEGGGGITKNVLKDQQVKIALKEPDTLELKLSQEGESRLMKTELGTETTPIYAIEKTYKVTAINKGQEDVTIESYLNLNEFQRITETDLERNKESSGSRARWDLNVKAGQETTFTYKMQEIQFQPVSLDEIKRYNPLLKSFEDPEKEIILEDEEADGDFDANSREEGPILI